MTLSYAQMTEIGRIRKRLADTHELRLVWIDNGKRGQMCGRDDKSDAAADAYNFLAALTQDNSLQLGDWRVDAHSYADEPDKIAIYNGGEGGDFSRADFIEHLARFYKDRF